MLNIRKRPQKEPHAHAPPPPINCNLPASASTASTPVSRLSSRALDFSNLDDMLMFPVENSHAYSYAHLSPNSLALRLNVLKRLLEILNERPDWLKLVQKAPEASSEVEKDIRKGPTASKEMKKAPSELTPPPADPKAGMVQPRAICIDAKTGTNGVNYDPSLRSPLAEDDAARKRLGPSHSLLAREGDRKFRPSASSAALSALFRPKIARSDSMPMSRSLTAENSECSSLHSNDSLIATNVHGKPHVSTESKSRGGTPELGPLLALSVPDLDVCSPDDDSEELFADELKDIIELLEQDPTLLSSKSDIAATLHDLSLSSATHDAQRKQNLLKTKLLFALATPFVESSGITSSLWEDNTSSASNQLSQGSSLPSSLQLSLMPNRQSSAALPTPPKAMAVNSGPNRPFHSFSAGKHTSPQSIITVEADFPWSFKAANDLACLMFGVLKSMIKNVTLIDLIAPQFRQFITEKMTRAISLRNSEKNIIFAGEIIAISRYSEGDFAWTSIWAQKKGNLIICMFEQITCDAFDLTLSTQASGHGNAGYSITNIEEVAGKLVSKLDASKLTDLAQLSTSLAQDLVPALDVLHRDSHDSELLNQNRYYTIQLGGEENIPCALTSYPLEKDPKVAEIRVKIHSMPYIAGMFVVDYATLEVMSCNKAIVKNLFGASYDEVLGSPIDNIMPNFSAILKTGLEDQEAGFSLVPGLVLPEHFFRKYDAKLKVTEQDRFERAFLGSRGIDGLHRDGSTLHIDVQLRVLRPEVFVLWVTYSRHTNKNIHRHVSKLSSEVSGLALPRQRSSRSIVNLPSQMKLFPKDEADILELGSNDDVSRHSSTRKPKRASTFAVPITYIADAGALKGARAVSINDSVSSHSEQMSVRPSSSDSNTTASSHYYRNFTEQEILDLENRELEERKLKSQFWPTRIGERKRTKKYDEFKVIKKMGEGAYGKVVLAEHKGDAAYQVIIKCIDKQRILVDTWVRDRQLGTIPSEIQVMATLNLEPHPNIMRIVDYFEDPNYYYLETPIFGNPPAIDLFDYIEVKHDMSELDCQLIFKQVTSAIYHLHKHGIIHRDIKDENIIVNEFGVVKLIDFGSAGYVKLGPFDVFVGTVDYASPEVLRGEKYEGKPQDIWALGVLLYTMIYKENPFYNVDEIMEANLRVPYIVSPKLNSLIESILVRDIDKRPSITDIAEDPWLEDV